MGISASPGRGPYVAPGVGVTAGLQGWKQTRDTVLHTRFITRHANRQLTKLRASDTATAARSWVPRVCGSQTNVRPHRSVLVRPQRPGSATLLMSCRATDVLSALIADRILFPGKNCPGHYNCYREAAALVVYTRFPVF